MLAGFFLFHVKDRLKTVMLHPFLLNLRDFVHILSHIPDRHSYVYMLGQPIVFVWTSWLEWRHFTPGTLESAAYQFAHLPWRNAVYGVVMVPGCYHRLVEQTAGMFRLRLVEGVPDALREEVSRTLAEDFPDQTPPADARMFTVESATACDRDDGFSYNQAREMEMARKIVHERDTSSPQQIWEYIVNDGDTE